MRLIDASYFVGPINIPNVDNPEVTEEVNAVIDEHQPLFLKKVLGLSLYNAYKAALALVTDDPPVVLEGRFLHLQDGIGYNDSGNILVNYEGLKKAFANYVYFKWMANKATETTAVGEVVNDTDNSTRVSPAKKMCSAWNQMVEYIYGLRSYLYDKASVYPEWQSSTFLNSQWRKINEFGI